MPAAKQGAIDNQKYNGTVRRHAQAIKIHTHNGRILKQIRHKAGNDGSENAEQDIATQAVTCLVENFAADKTCHQTNCYPTEKINSSVFLLIGYQHHQSV